MTRYWELQNIPTAAGFLDRDSLPRHTFFPWMPQQEKKIKHNTEHSNGANCPIKILMPTSKSDKCPTPALITQLQSLTPPPCPGIQLSLLTVEATIAAAEAAAEAAACSALCCALRASPSSAVRLLTAFACARSAFVAAGRTEIGEHQG